LAQPKEEQLPRMFDERIVKCVLSGISGEELKEKLKNWGYDLSRELGVFFVKNCLAILFFEVFCYNLNLGCFILSLNTKMISLSPETIFKFDDFKITNTYLASLFSLILIFSFALILRSKIKEIPGKAQNFLEIIFDGFYNFWSNITESKSLKLFTFCFTFFIYVLISNWLGILPGFGSIYIKHGEEKIHLLRSTYSDLNMTLGLALLSVLGSNITGFVQTKTKYLKRFLSFMGPLEIISELSKILSFSLRLFGNILAGEVLLLSVSSLIPFLIPIPFLGLEIFVGFIQALIFFTLTAIFLKVAISEH